MRAHGLSYASDDILKVEKIIDFPGGDHEHMNTYYDKTGELSYETYLLKAGLSKGLPPIGMKKQRNTAM